MPIPQPTIADWTTTQLVKFVKDILDQQPPRHLPSSIQGTTTITDELILKGQLTIPDGAEFSVVGKAGEPAFTNGWLDWGAPYFPPGFWKDPLGFVHLRGVIKSGTVGSPAFTLPPGYRPGAGAVFAALSNNAAGRVDVGADGTVTPSSPSSNAWVSLSGIHFRLT